MNNSNNNMTLFRRMLLSLRNFFDIDRWQEIWITITHNKMRSVMTAFGVFWGMFMLVVMVGAGVALERGISSNIEGFATNSCFIWTNSTSEPYKGFKKGRRWNMTNEDVKVLRNNVAEIEYIAPVLFGNSSSNNVLRNDKSGTFNIKGNYPVYNLIDESKLSKGRYINDIDIAEKRKVCVIGQRVADILFPNNEDPLGKSIQVQGVYFNVVGVTRSSSSVNIGGDAQETVVLPFSTMQQAFNQGNIVHFLAVTAKPGIKVSVMEKQIHDILKQRNSISPDDKTAVGGMNIEDDFTMFLYLGIGIASLIWIVGLGTLLAGAIGVSNIMLVTVRERTKEIGIRRALGATPKIVMNQILTETIVIVLMAGLTGIMVGVGLLNLIGMATEGSDAFFKDPQISFSVAMIALFILMLIGAFAGYLPAKRAVSVKPIDAIREE